MLHILGHLAGRSLLLHKCQACLCNLQLLQAYKAPLDEIVNPCKWLIFIEIPLSTYLWPRSWGNRWSGSRSRWCFALCTTIVVPWSAAHVTTWCRFWPSTLNSWGLSSGGASITASASNWSPSFGETLKLRPVRLRLDPHVCTEPVRLPVRRLHVPPQ